MTARTNHISGAVAELLAEREHLSARLAKVDAAIAAVRDAFHLPADRTPRHMVKAPAARNGNHSERQPRAAGLTVEALHAALRSGPLSPGDLARKLGMNRAVLRYRLKPFEVSGQVVATGTTANRLIELPSGKPAAKEAP